MSEFKIEKDVAIPGARGEVLQAYKGFDLNFACRGFTFKVGKTYTHEGDLKLCQSGFHACEVPLDCWSYYPPTTSKYGVVDLGGATNEKRDDSKRVGNRLTVKASINIIGLVRAQVEWTQKHANKKSMATGYSGHAAATGDSGHAAATGNYGHAAATGDYGCAFAGFEGIAKASATGSFAIAWYDKAAKRARLIVGTPVENGIKADTPYRVNDSGELEEVK